MPVPFQETEIASFLQQARAPTSTRVGEILQKASAKKGLALGEVAELLLCEENESIKKMLAASSKIKEEIYGRRIVFFAPLYLSNFCANDCAYCGFHASSNALRKKLSTSEIEEQARILLEMGHKRLLLEAGEHPENSIEFVVDAIKTIYGVRVGRENIRRVNVNIAATTVKNYQKLKEAGIGTYQLFQETYHRPTYEKLHKGPKADYERQITAHERAFAAGIDDYGLGVLYGLYDWQFETLAVIAHAQYLEKKLGVGPHTISVPRFRPAQGVSFNPEFLPSDANFLKIISIIRLAVPYTGMILSTRESPEMRAKAFEIGISQASAASETSPGGYRRNGKVQATQFEVHDSRTLAQVVESVCSQGFLPSFCTSCYRAGRTGDDFMALAKTGKIQDLCQPNALLTFKEYLLDHANEAEREKGEKIIAREAEKIQNLKTREEFFKRMARLEQGERDLYF